MISKTVNMIIAIVAGVLVLLGYFFPAVLGSIQTLILQWAVILAAFAFLVGVVNLFSVHLKKIRQQPGKSFNNLILLVSLVATIFVVGFVSGPTGSWSLWVFNYIQVPVESSLMAVLTIALAYAAIRLIRRRTNSFTLIFLITALVVLLGTAPLYLVGDVPFLSGMRTWVAQVLGVGGARGLLLGISLGAIAAGIRVLMGVDRPYGG